MIALARPDIEQDDLEAVNRVLATGMLVQGENVEDFEREAEKWLEKPYRAAAVANGTAALHLALLALNIQPGDRVFVPAYSWPATANVVELVKAVPIFIDIDPHSFNMSPVALAKALEHDRKCKVKSAKALIVVHAFGCPADMDRISALTGEFGLALIEDAACAIGSTWQGRWAGSLGDLACFSLHPRKIVTTGEGGLVATQESGLLRQIKALRNHGLDPAAATPDFIRPGFNYRMTDFQASLGVAQLKKLGRLVAQRRSQAQRYNKAFTGSAIKPQTISVDAESNYQAYVVTLPQVIDRDNIVKELARHGIASNIGTWHIPLTRYYRDRYGFTLGDFPATDQVFAASLALPLHSQLTADDIDFVAATLLNSIK